MKKEKKDKPSDEWDGFTELEKDYGIRIFEDNTFDMHYVRKTDKQGNILNPLTGEKFKELDETLDLDIGKQKIQDIEIVLKNDEIQKLAKTRTDDFLVRFIQPKGKDILVLSKVTEKVNPENVIYEQTWDDYKNIAEIKGIKEVETIVFNELEKKDPTVIGYRKVGVHKK